MSATVDVDLHAEYFSVPVANRMVHATKIMIDSKMFKIFDFYIEQIIMDGVSNRKRSFVTVVLLCCRNYKFFI